MFGTYLDEVLMMRNAAGTKYYYHAHHLYSVHAITNSAGAIVEAVQSYDAYGKPTILTGAGTDATWFTGDDVVGSVSAIGNPWFYTGQRLDAETGLMYYKNRYMSVELGRFVGRDPIGYAGGSLGLYAYVNSRPSRSVDPFGFEEEGPKPSVPETEPKPKAPDEIKQEAVKGKFVEKAEIEPRDLVDVPEPAKDKGVPPDSPPEGKKQPMPFGSPFWGTSCLGIACRRWGVDVGWKVDPEGRFIPNGCKEVSCDGLTPTKTRCLEGETEWIVWGWKQKGEGGEFLFHTISRSPKDRYWQTKSGSFGFSWNWVTDAEAHQSAAYPECRAEGSTILWKRCFCCKKGELEFEPGGSRKVPEEAK